MSDESRARERLELLAHDHLGEYPQDDAIKALTDIENVEPGEVPDDVLVEAARQFLDASRTADARYPRVWDGGIWRSFTPRGWRGWRSRR